MMKAWILFLLLSLLLGSVQVQGVAFKQGSGFYLYEGKEDATAVIEFKPGRDFKDSKAPKIVIFYSPFCGHCINYAPKYMQLSKDVTAKYPEVEFWAVSCKSHRDECAKHTIRGYPTIHSYKAGSEESTVLGSNTDEAQIVKALQLDKPVPEVDRKLVLEEEDKEDETEGTTEKEDEDAADNQEGEGTTEKEDEDDAEKQVDLEGEEEKDTADSKDEEKEDKEGVTNKDEEDAADSQEGEGTTEDEDNEDEEASEAADEDNDADKKTDEVESREAKESEQDDESEEEADENEKPADVDETESEDHADVDEPKEQEVSELVESKEQADLAVESDEPEDVYEDADKTEASKDEEDVDADEDETDAEEDEDSDADENEDSVADEEEAEGRKKRRKQHDSPESEDFEESKDDAPRDAHSTTDAGKAYRAQREANNGVKSDAGALKGNLETRDMDKWRQIIAERRKSLEKRKALLRMAAAKTAEPGATKVMKANTPGTTEYSNRVQSLLKKINTLRKKRGVPPLTTPVEITKKAKKALKKEVKKPGLAEKVPLIKRLVKMTPEEANILDSSLSFMAGLKYGLFMTDDALTAKQRAALKSWLDLLSVSLPPEWGLHALIDELNDNIDTVAQGNQHLLRILRKHPLPRSIYSASCRKPGSPQGFSCGLWKLFHTVTVGIAEHRGGLNLVQSGGVAVDTRTFSPADAAATIREYIAHFFGCTECRNHFIAQYDQCYFRRCDRLTSDAVTATPDDWKQLPLWLWEVHNDVSVRVAHEKIERQIESSNNLSRTKVARLTRTDEIKHLFPSLETCFQCFDENGSWNEDAVFEYLEASYWSEPDAMADKLLQYKDSDAKGSGSDLIWFFVIVLLAGIYIMRGRKGGLQRSMNAALVTGRKIGGKKRSV